jgi:hypothetical protein
MLMGKTIGGRHWELYRKQRREERLFLALSGMWFIILLFFICIANFDGVLLDLQFATFRWNPHPNFKQLLIFSDFNIVHRHYAIVKVGHFVGFAILEIMLYKWCKQKSVTVLLTVLAAVSTEVLQLFCGRDGRIYDMMIDLAGVTLSYFFIKIKE